ncbi:hypothetical protein DC3_19130 [Deinococcus cellulosilyticus NBRC 106333 = KACC 11606]|uniref:Uncharacterized protein n=2 Tax=Deinococcus cellulosilyticus TaxID=401558 RepID=A0A511N1E4_DEIC1|nr:hypothetical protein DC3_19130 [Deinococcus cellulosilyticus NBRC 106333 = KACC 11606]
MQFRVVGSSSLVTLPFEASIKDGPGLARLILALGILIAIVASHLKAYDASPAAERDLKINQLERQMTALFSQDLPQELRAPEMLATLLDRLKFARMLVEEHDRTTVDPLIEQIALRIEMFSRLVKVHQSSDKITDYPTELNKILNLLLSDQVLIKNDINNMIDHLMTRPILQADGAVQGEQAGKQLQPPNSMGIFLTRVMANLLVVPYSTPKLWMRFLLYLVFVCLLSMVVFANNYDSNPVFGADYRDYLALFLAGAGAQLTGQTIGSLSIAGRGK